MHYHGLLAAAGSPATHEPVHKRQEEEVVSDFVFCLGMGMGISVVVNSPLSSSSLSLFISVCLQYTTRRRRDAVTACGCRELQRLEAFPWTALRWPDAQRPERLFFVFLRLLSVVCGLHC
jgi:hypothetical protein